MGNTLKTWWFQIVLGAAMLLSGMAFLSWLLFTFWDMRDVSHLNPFSRLVWSVMETTGAAFMAGAALIGGIWIVSTAAKQRHRSQP